MLYHTPTQHHHYSRNKTPFHNFSLELQTRSNKQFGKINRFENDDRFKFWFESKVTYFINIIITSLPIKSQTDDIDPFQN